MTKREQVIKYARLFGLNVKVNRGDGPARGVVTLHKACRGHWRGDWADCFDNWSAAYDFLRDCKEGVERGRRMPWEGKPAAGSNSP